MRSASIKIGLGALCVLLLAAPAHAQKTKAELSAEVSATFPDNTAGQITPAGMRAFQNDLINSIMPTAPVVSGNLACFNGTTGLLQDCGTAPDTITIGITNIASGTSSRVLYNNAGKVAEYDITGTGSVVMSSGAAIASPTISNPTFSGTASGAGTIPTTLLSGTLPAANFGALTGDVTTPSGSYVASIAANAVTNAKMATMAARTVKGNATGGSATPTDVAPAAARSSSLLNIDSFTGHGDSAYSITATDRVVGTNAAFTASRTWTLPAANAVNPGQSILVADFQGTVTGSNTLIIARAGSDTINGGPSVTINTANGAYFLVSDGSSKWTAQAVGSSIASGVSSIDGVSGPILTEAGSLKVVGSTLSSNVLSSRTFAATQDLSAFSAVRTLGYATAGDGGGATFQKIGAGTPFKDSYILTGTIAGGSGYTNGTYLGVPMGGGAGLGCTAKVTVAGGAVTTVDLSGGFCNGYAVGNVLIPLTSAIGGTGSGATFTVTTISTATGSFTDSAGNLWQYVVDAGNWPNVRQFGAKIDWAGVDGSATNDLPAFKSAFAFMSTTNSASAAIINGGTLYVPKGASYLCASPAQFATLQIPNGVTLKGAGVYGGTTLKQCTGSDSGEHFVSLCDPNSQFGQFGCRLDDIALVMTGSSSLGTAAIYSNSGQQFPLVNNVYIQPAGRQCIKYEIGKGGASNAIFENFDCEVADSTSNVGFSGNASGTQILIRNAVFGCAPGNCGAGRFAINMIAGNFIMENVHIEQHVDAVNVGTTGASQLSTARNFTITSGCINGFTIPNSNPNNTFLVENVESSCNTATVLNGHSGGSNVTGNILAQRVFNP